MSIAIDLARRILEASKQRAQSLRSPVSIAIVDAGGHLVLFERMMSPYGWATGNISIAKANTAVMFNQSTDAVAQWAAAIPGFAASLSSMTDGKFIMAAGGWPIRVNGITIGGIGVSGGNAPGRDEDIARAGLAVLQEWVQAAPQPQYAQPAQPVQQAPQFAQSAPQGPAFAPSFPPPSNTSSQVFPVQPLPQMQSYSNGGVAPASDANRRENAPAAEEPPRSQYLASGEENYPTFREESAPPSDEETPGDR